MKEDSCIFFDLDGTLLDSKERLYKLFTYLVPENMLDFDAYWKIKREQKGHAHILKEYYHYSENAIAEFEQKWQSEIEQPQWLQYDKPFDWVNDFLNYLYPKYRLYIVTARQSEQVVKKQLAQFEWSNLLADVLVTKQQKEKHELINSLSINKDNSWIVGDTGNDIQTGQLSGIKTAGVLTGFRNREILGKYNPNILVDKALDLKNIL